MHVSAVHQESSKRQSFHGSLLTTYSDHPASKRALNADNKNIFVSANESEEDIGSYLLIMNATGPVASRAVSTLH